MVFGDGDAGGGGSGRLRHGGFVKGAATQELKWSLRETRVVTFSGCTRQPAALQILEPFRGP